MLDICKQLVKILLEDSKLMRIRRSDKVMRVCVGGGVQTNKENFC